MNKTQRNLARLTALSLVLGLPVTAFAVDGVLEINQACAANTGCFAGDAAGFPVTVTGTTSVRLTSNLTVPNENTTAIDITAGEVTVDLNGFSILGPNTCPGVPAGLCTANGTGQGIDGAGGTGLVVLNGTVRGMGDRGVFAGFASRIEGVHVTNNRIGISTSNDALVAGCVVDFNGSTGIATGEGSVVRDNAVRGNGGVGIDASESIVLGNAVSDNGGHGLSANAGGFTSGYGNNNFDNNNGSDANAQVLGGLEIAPNICGGSLTCP